MPTIKLKPVTPGSRGTVRVVSKDLHKGRPWSSLVAKHKKATKKAAVGRNNQGRITTRHRGGGHKRLYRIIDFKRTKDDIPARVVRLEYDPNRSANIALILYADGEYRYIIATRKMKAGQTVLTGPKSPMEDGNCMPLSAMLLGSEISCLELKPGGGACVARSAGSSARLTAREDTVATVRLRSGETRRVSTACRATLGAVSNPENNLRKFGKAGAKRWRGVRPTVRGVAMNPIDHPHGGGEGRTSTGGPPVTPWGKQTKGLRTRKNRRTDRFIIRRSGK